MNLSTLIQDAIDTGWRGIRHPDRHSAKAVRILDLMGDRKVAAWGLDESNELAKRLLAEDRKPSTVNKYLSVLDSLGLRVSYLPVITAEKRVLSKAELERLDLSVKVTFPSPTNVKCQAVYAILRDTGCRGLTELRRLDPTKDLDWVHKTVTFTSFKGGKRTTRTVPMSDVAEKALAWFHHAPSLPTDGQWRHFWLAVRLDDSNRPYDLRHTFCTRLIDGGVPDMAVMEIMGHSSLEMTKEYHHLTQTALSNARGALNDELHSSPPSTH